MTLLALLRLLVIRECVFVKRWREMEKEMEREMEKEGNGEGNGERGRWRGRKRENVSMAAESGGFFLFFQTRTSTKGVYWLMRSATIHEERESQCVIPLFSS